MYTDGRLPQAFFEGLAVNTLVSLSGKQAFFPISLEAETFYNILKYSCTTWALSI